MVEWFKLLTELSHVMRKPVYAICEQQRCRSACTSAQSDQRLCGRAGWFESYLVENSEDRFSLDKAHIVTGSLSGSD